MPSAEEMAAAGFSPDDYDTGPVEVLPENWPAWALFCEMSGQWRTAPMGGATGLDYTPLFMRMDRLDLGPDDWEAMFQDIRHIAASALTAMRSAA